MNNTQLDRPESLPSEIQVVRAVWPTLVASAVGLLPFTVFTTFLVDIAGDVDGSDALVGSLRGLAGIGAVIVGIALAPLIGRISPGRLAASALAILAIASVVGAVAWVPALIAFCLLTGLSNAVLYPALSAAAADRFASGPASARAATMVMTSQTLASTLGAPLLVIPTLWWGWRGDLLAIAAIALLLVPLLVRFDRTATSVDEAGSSGAAAATTSYLGAFRAVAAIPGTGTLWLIAFARTAALMGYLAFLAPLYADRFDLAASQFAWVWGLSGGSFFVGHLIAGRLLNRVASDRWARRVMAVSLVVALAAMNGVYFSLSLLLALVATAVLSASHAVVAAAVVSLLVRRCGSVRGPALSINTVSMSLGLFVGVTVSGAALGLVGLAGSAAALSALTVVALLSALSLSVDHDESPTPPSPSTSPSTPTTGSR